MSEAKSSEWTAAWIAQQREMLRKQAAAAGPDAPKGQGGPEMNPGMTPGMNPGMNPGMPPEMTEEVRELGEKWRALGQSYLGGLAQYSQQATQQPGAAHADKDGAQFKVGDELLNVWRSAWSTVADMQQGTVSSVSDLLARLPPIGLAREHTEAWRELAAAQAECQRLEQELRVVLQGVQRDALDLLEQRVSERARKGETLDSYRDLYDLWVDCAEHVYAKVAHSEAYCKLQAELGNASMRLRSHQQKIIERGLKQFDLPTRSELNTVHRQLREQKQRIANLELKLQQAGGAPPAARKPRAPEAKTAARPQAVTKKSAPKSAPKKSGTKKSGASKTVARKTATRKTATRKKGGSR